MDSLLAALEEISVRLWYCLNFIQTAYFTQKNAQIFFSSEKPSPSVFECQLNIFLKCYREWPSEDKIDFATNLVKYDVRLQ